jgi:RyR domain
METILVTGDIVLDCHLYGGVYAGVGTAAASAYTEHLGGAALTHKLLAAAASAAAQAKKQVAPAYGTQLDLDTRELQRTLPEHLRSYGVWVAQPVRKGSRDLVWRVERDFGYGSAEPPRESVFERNPAQAPSSPILTLIDDGGILFRNGTSRSAWPEFPDKEAGHYLLKTTSPLCRGDLWAALEPVMDRLIVVASVGDLRREDAQINSRLSWEQCAEDTIRELRDDPIVRGLGRAAHVIVSFGSAGALWADRGRDGQAAAYHLVFDPAMLEGDYSLAMDGRVYGVQTCLAVGIAHHLMQRNGEADGAQILSPFADGATFGEAMVDGVAAGLLARRSLMDRGHGRVDKPNPGFPHEALGGVIAGSPVGFVTVRVPSDACRPGGCRWTILDQSEASATSSVPANAPLTGLAQLTARYGLDTALSKVPAFRVGNLFTVDRSEAESLRTLDGLIRMYESIKSQKTPLCIGVFGPPGAGKSFGVKALAKGILGKDGPFLEFNLSQFTSPDELIGAFHRVRDAVLRGITPVAFWDEFDSQSYTWLQYLLAPMQDGAFQDGQITHPIGKCIFIFAGGTSPTLEGFGVKEPIEPSSAELAALGTGDRAERRREFGEASERYRGFKLLKGPDFISRLHGFLNVLGPNPRTESGCIDITWPIRRAIILRAILGGQDVLDLKGSDELDIDPGLLDALLGVPAYRHGARSFEKIIRVLVHDSRGRRLRRSALPSEPLLDRETDAAEFHRLLTQRDAFKTYPDLEDLAAAIHFGFLDAAEKSRLEAEAERNPGLVWGIDASIAKRYVDLSDDMKAANRAAARRIPDHLSLIGYVVEPQQPGGDDSWKGPIREAINTHVERLALAEHLGWCAERIANGWTYAEVRDNAAKHHPLLVPWVMLSRADQDKDRASVLAIPASLDIARFKAVPVQGPKG